MFYWIYEAYGDEYGLLRIFSYVTFRALAAGLISMFFSFFLGKRIINFLYQLKFKETVRNDGPKSHESKTGTPTMGGLMIIISLSISVILWGNLNNLNLVLLFIMSLGFCALGFGDDYMKAIMKVKGGMRARTKFLISIILSLIFVYTYYNITGKANPNIQKGIVFEITDLFLPFIKGSVLSLGWIAIPFAILVVIGTSHAVNLTDGLDGLATGTMLFPTITFGIIAYVSGTPVTANYLNIPYLPGAHEYSVFLSALAGSLIGFLWFNSHPAQVFMGDTGSLFLGATLGMVAIMLKKEILLIILGGVFVIEALSVILQVGSFKLRGKRIFRMSPIHHHFELMGIPEEKIVIRFWIVGILLALISLSSLKIQ
ncbi:phospho-N-acetylmuramoyl-pentapeptide-transferase [Leptospira sp. GIMC2001]|uniref:phospho-N-acetylmuramoyl-pentapeptide- transferase n=1 Tax=Leptospira sp. GIMC2001 TaxID=1513297 RepID=UPI00234A7E82|nr:phospho-N-acetylmuramoyl-pentapeptide-transferase [Leptospira sp. GIMC2001]WCL47983.1 phospho-N-acetylmuramoyl-pentapeptide-transferase [Leptospira sp. GIMC2001]